MQRLLILTLLIFTACASLPGYPGYISTSASKFDNATEISMEPAVVQGTSFSSGGFQLGLFRKSTMAADEAIMTAVTYGVESFSEPSIEFNIDGETVSLNSIDTFTDFEYEPGYGYTSPSTYSAKRYRINKALIERLINAKQVYVRLNLEKTYIDGNFSGSTVSTMALPAFKAFYARAWP